MRVIACCVFLAAACCVVVRANEPAYQPVSGGAIGADEMLIPTDTNNCDISVLDEHTAYDSTSWTNSRGKTSSSLSVAGPTAKRSRSSRSNDDRLWIAALLAVGGLGLVIVGAAMLRGRKKRSSRGWSADNTEGAERRLRVRSSALLANHLIHSHNNSGKPSIGAKKEETMRRAA